MSGPVHQHDVPLVVDLVDHAEVSASRRVQTFKLSDERLAGAARILGDGSEYRFDDGGSDLLGKLAEVAEPFGSDVDLVRHSELVFGAGVLETHSLPGCGFAPRTAHRVQ